MAKKPPPLEIDPPLVNSSNPWATTLEDLRALYACTSTGAVTTRTSLLMGFGHNPAKHSYVFFDPANNTVVKEKAEGEGHNPLHSEPNQTASLNSLGYSPYTLETYLGFIKTIASEQQQQQQQTTKKGFIISVTGTPADVADCYRLIAWTKQHDAIALPLAVEVNLSCPNIPGAPPPAYSEKELRKYLEALRRAAEEEQQLPRLPYGLKTPPYTHAGEFDALVDALGAEAYYTPGGMCPVSFVTATNTLGSCLVFGSSSSPDAGAGPEAETETALVPALPTPTGIGGMAGAPLHALALGNVATLRRMLDEYDGRTGRSGMVLRHVRIVGTGGVADTAGFQRMRAAGASVVGVGTALGARGVRVFGEIEKGLGGFHQKN